MSGIYSEEAPLFERSIKSSPTAKAAEKEHKDNKKNNFIKSVHQAVPTRENWEHPDSFQRESVSSAFNE